MRGERGERSGKERRGEENVPLSFYSPSSKGRRREKGEKAVESEKGRSRGRSRRKWGRLVHHNNNHNHNYNSKTVPRSCWMGEYENEAGENETSYRHRGNTHTHTIYIADRRLHSS